MLRNFWIHQIFESIISNITHISKLRKNNNINIKIDTYFSSNNTVTVVSGEGKFEGQSAVVLHADVLQMRWRHTSDVMTRVVE